ncbi:hypothetical protein [Belnapia sp. F-4-1]|uniref:hypothetical protein n=1 Tax=Belnapia sp. F-4-1 TaxID=1545443 RepID=UPI0013649F79|nr:hypothetical protein [Belnapia sp. F-4-1]
MYEFVAIVRLSNGMTQRVSLHADDIGRARAMLEAQYGHRSVLNLGRPARR